MDEQTVAPLSLQQQTIELGKVLKAISDSDPSGLPTGAAEVAFTAWIAEAGPGSRRPDYFQDVRENYDIPGNSNRDLWELFHMLESHIEVEDEDFAEADEDAPRKTFIGLPLLGA